MTQCKPLPPVELLREYFDYDPADGVLRYKKPRKRIRVGSPVSRGRSSGYLSVSMDRQNYLVHRVIWKMMTGEDPPSLVDHKDRCTLNNRWTNLRGSTATTNNQNKVKHGKLLPGVHQRKGRINFYAQIRVNKKPIHLGTFSTELEAHQAYRHACSKYFGEFSIYAV